MTDPPEPRPTTTRSFAGCVVGLALLAAPAVAELAPRSGWMLTGSGSGHYDGGEMGDLAQTLLTVLYVLVSDEDDYDYRYDCHDCCYDDDLHLSIPQAQYGFGLSYTITPSIALGARVLYRNDHRRNDIAQLWGAVRRSSTTAMVWATVCAPTLAPGCC